MKKRRPPYLIILALVIIGIVTVLVDVADLLRTQVLRAPEILSPIKLIRLESDPVQFDIYYEHLKDEQPDDIGILIISALISADEVLSNETYIIDQLLLLTGEEEIIDSLGSQNIYVRNMRQQSTTKLGTLITNIPAGQYISLEYDTDTQGRRITQFDNPPAIDFPLDYHSFQNPTNELLYVSTANYHSILSPLERIYTKTESIPHGAMLLPDTITTMQTLDSLSVNTLIAKSISRETPRLRVEQSQIIVPGIPENNLNTLIIRYLPANGKWLYKSFLLSASTDITLPVPVEDLTDFYSELEYSFAYISNAHNTLNLDYPYNSLISDGYPVFYRTKYVTLMPELYANTSSLEFELTVNTYPNPEGIYIAVIATEQLTSLEEVVHQLLQKQSLLIFDEPTVSYMARVSDPANLPHINLVGKNNQIWSSRINEPNLNLISEDFESIELIPDDAAIPELEVVNLLSGDKLICLVKTDSGSHSVSPISGYQALTTDCLIAARRAGLLEGRIYPIHYQADNNQLKALKHFDYDENLSAQEPIIRDYKPLANSLSLTSILGRDTVKLLVSPDKDFDNFVSVNMSAMDINTYAIPSLPGCDVYCYLKVLSVPREDANILLGYASETLLYATDPEPLIQVCFANQDLVDKVYNPSDLELQILMKDSEPIDMTYQASTGCYELILNEDLNSSEDGTRIFLSLSDFVYRSPELDPNTIVIHSNGLASNHITIPPQRHYLSLSNGSEQQLLLRNLIYEHASLSTKDQPSISNVNQTSYQISLMGRNTTLFSQNRGSIIIQKQGSIPYFLQEIDVPSTLNESVLFPDREYTLAVPNTIRFFPTDELVVQGFSEADKLVHLTLDIPKKSIAKIFLEDIFRPDILIQQDIQDGITFAPDSGFMSLKNPTGSISIPLRLNIVRVTDTEIYGSTFPPTPVPDDIDVAFIDTRLILSINHPENIPSGDLINPIVIPRAPRGFGYQEQLDLLGIEDQVSFQAADSKFFNDNCDEIFSFDTQTRTLSADVPVNTDLDYCFFQITVKYLTRETFAEMEISTDLVYLIPISASAAEKTEVEIIRIPIDKDVFDVDQVINLIKPLESLVETGPDFIDALDDTGLIRPIGDLNISFDEASQQLLLSGSGDALKKSTSRFVRAIEKESGRIVLFELVFLSVQSQEIFIPIVREFPNQIDIPVVLDHEGFSEEEIATAVVVTDALSTVAAVDENNSLLIYGLEELNDQVFTVLMEREDTTPSEFVEFEEKVTGIEADVEPDVISIDFVLQIIEPESITLQPVDLRTDRSISLDIRTFVPGSRDLVASQVPDFLKRRGNILTGRTPGVATEIEVLLKDYSNVRNIILPLNIVEPEPIIEDEDDEDPGFGYGYDDEDEDDIDLHGSPEETDCFPDISHQPLEYQEAICLAKDFKIVSGSGGLFKPNDVINRAEVSKVLVTGPLVIFNILSQSEVDRINSEFTRQSFSDVPRSAWFYGFIETVKSVGIFDGYPDGSFRAGNSLIQAEAAKVIVNTLDKLKPEALTGADSIAENSFPGDIWFAPFVRILNNNGGDLAAYFEIAELAQPITRAQFIYNLMILLDSKAGSL